MHLFRSSCTFSSSGTTGTCRRKENMEIVIDIESTTPLFTQLIEQIKKGVMNNTLETGAQLPSIRQLANDLEINNKTVAKAYRLLERDSIIQTKGYRGTFIHPDAKVNCGVDLGEWTHEKLREIVNTLREAGVTDSEIRIAFGKIMNNRNH